MAPVCIDRLAGSHLLQPRLLPRVSIVWTPGLTECSLERQPALRGHLLLSGTQRTSYFPRGVTEGQAYAIVVSRPTGVGRLRKEGCEATAPSTLHGKAGLSLPRHRLSQLYLHAGSARPSRT